MNKLFRKIVYSKFIVGIFKRMDDYYRPDDIPDLIVGIMVFIMISSLFPILIPIDLISMVIFNQPPYIVITYLSFGTFLYLYVFIMSLSKRGSDKLRRWLRYINNERRF